MHELLTAVVFFALLFAPSLISMRAVGETASDE